MGIDFGGIVSRSFRIAFKYPSLWILGLFASSGAGRYNFNLPKDSDFDLDGGSFGLVNPDWIERFVEQHILPILGIVIAVVLLLLIVLTVCNTIAKGGLYDAVNKLTRGGNYRFGTSFSRSLDFFWRMLGIGLVQFCLMILIVGIAVLLAFVSLFTLILTIPVCLALIVPIFHIFELGRVALVARDADLSSSLAEGWELLKNNIGNVTIVTLLYLALLVGFGIVYLIIAGIFFLPVGLAVAGITDQFWPALIWAVVLGLPVSLVLGGFGGTFFHALYAQFYFQLLEPGLVRPLAVGGLEPPAARGPSPDSPFSPPPE